MILTFILRYTRSNISDEFIKFDDMDSVEMPSSQTNSNYI
jgi:hypothetical protein